MENETTEIRNTPLSSKNKKAPVLVIAVVVLALLGGAYYAWHNRNPEVAVLNKPFIVPDRFDPTIKAEMEAKVKQATEDLRANPELKNSWLEIAVYRKAIEDYDGAEAIWLHVADHWPEDTIAFNNLGDLYANYLKDYPRAEKYLLKTVELKPDYIPGYRNLYDLYHNNYKQDTNAATDILLKGLEKNPKSTDLLISLAVHYKETGKTEEARTYFEKALTEAKAEGNTSLETTLRAELAALK